MRDLLRALEEGRTIHVAVRELPDALRAALKAVGYGAKDVGVTPQDAVTPNAYAGEGQKGFVVIVNLETGKRETLGGDWGGGGMSLKPIDAASQDVRIPPNGAVIIGTEGWPRTMASIYVHPDGIARLLPPAAAVTDREQLILRTIRSLTSAGRKEVFGREKVTPAEIDALVARGLLRKTKAGAVSITTDGKNVAEGQEAGMRDLLRRLEEAEAAPGFATRKDLTKLGFQPTECKAGVPKFLLREVFRDQAQVERALAEGGVFTFGRGYFYRNKQTPEDFGQRVLADLVKGGLQPTLLASGDHWAAFKGGAAEMSAGSSFFWAIVQVRTAQAAG